MSPDRGYAGTKVTIKGSGFGTPGAVKFGTLVAKVSSWTGTSIVVKVPEQPRVMVLSSSKHSVPVWYRHDQEVRVTAASGLNLSLSSNGTRYGLIEMAGTQVRNGAR